MFEKNLFCTVVVAILPLANAANNGVGRTPPMVRLLIVVEVKHLLCILRQTSGARFVLVLYSILTSPPHRKVLASMFTCTDGFQRHDEGVVSRQQWWRNASVREIVCHSRIKEERYR